MKQKKMTTYNTKKIIQQDKKRRADQPFCSGSPSLVVGPSTVVCAMPCDSPISILGCAGRAALRTTPAAQGQRTPSIPCSQCQVSDPSTVSVNTARHKVMVIPEQCCMLYPGVSVMMVLVSRNSCFRGGGVA